MPVDLIIEGAVAKVVLNRPERLNALTWEMRQQLREYFSELRFNEAVRAIIVTGEGRAFCTGADVGGMERKELRGEREKLQAGSHSYMRVLASIEKPVIAAVRGPTVGIGWSIAMGCDLIVASETSRFSQIFRRIGLAPDGGAICSARNARTRPAKDRVTGSLRQLPTQVPVSVEWFYLPSRQ